MSIADGIRSALQHLQQAAPASQAAAAAPTDKAAAQQKLVDDVRNADDRHRGVVLAQGMLDLQTRFGDDAAAEAYAQLARVDPRAAAQATATFYANEDLPPDQTAWLDPTRTPQGQEATIQMFANGTDEVHRLFALGQAQVGQLDAGTRATFSHELADQASKSSAPTVFAGISRDLVASNSDAMQRSFSQEAIALASTQLGKDGDPTSSNWPDYLSMLGQVAKESPSAARDLFHFVQGHSLGTAKAGNEALEAMLQAFASDGSGLWRRAATNSLTPSYLDFMDALTSSSAAQGALSASDALQLFETVSNSAEDIQGVSLIEQGDKDEGSRGTAQMAELFTRYMPEWTAARFAWDPVHGGYDQLPPLIAGLETGTLSDRYDKAISNFMKEAMFDPNEDGAYRQKLLDGTVGLLGALASGAAGRGLSADARGRLAGNLIGLIDQGFNQYANQIHGDAEATKAWANFGISLGFALLPGPQGKIAGILFSQASGQLKGGAQSAIAQLVDAGVDRKIAEAAVSAASDGDLVGALEKLGFSEAAITRVKEYVNGQSNSFASGNLSLGELLRQIFGDAQVVSDPAFAKGVKDGWDQIDDRHSKPG